MDQFSLLRLIVAIAEHHSLVGAARSLAVSPSTVTLGLQRLEEQTGCRLVTRSTRSVTLTPEGERFVADARRILEDLSETMAALREDGPLKGPIRLTATHDFGRTRLVPLLDQFMTLHPGVHVAVFFSDGVVDLAEAGFDFAIRISGNPQAAARANTHLLRRGTRRVCAARSYWDRMGRPEHPRDLANHNCLFVTRPESPESSWSFAEGERTFHVRVSGDRTANDGSAIRSWAVGGAGVIFNASFDVADDVDAGRLEPVLDAFTRQEVNLYAVQLRKGGVSRRVQTLIDWLDAEL